MNRSQRGGIIFRLLGLLVLLFFLAIIYSVRHPLMRLAGRSWVAGDPLAHADAILIIGDDNFRGERAARAAELFRAGWAPRVVASGRRLRPFAGIAELMEQDLSRDGVPASALSTFPHTAANTTEEAEALAKFAAGRNWHRVIVVTSNYHARRARYIFRKVFPSGISVVVAPATDSDFDPSSWWTSRRSQGLFLHEIAGYCLAMWDLRHSPA